MGATKVKKKIIAAIKSTEGNESVDFWLTLYDRNLSMIPNNYSLDVHFASNCLFKHFF